MLCICRHERFGGAAACDQAGEGSEGPYGAAGRDEGRWEQRPSSHRRKGVGSVCRRRRCSGGPYGADSADPPRPLRSAVVMTPCADRSQAPSASDSYPPESCIPITIPSQSTNTWAVHPLHGDPQGAGASRCRQRTSEDRQGLTASERISVNVSGSTVIQGDLHKARLIKANGVFL